MKKENNNYLQTLVSWRREAECEAVMKQKVQMMRDRTACQMGFLPLRPETLNGEFYWESVGLLSEGPQAGLVVPAC